MLAHFGAFLRLYVAYGDASPNTIRSYLANARQFIAWCAKTQIHPASATEEDILQYRCFLVAHYANGTVATRLASIRRLFEALVWRGLRADNPVAGVKPPRERTHRADTVKYLSLDGLRRVLDAPKGDHPQAIRDRNILTLQGKLGLRVSEIAQPRFDSQGDRWLGMEVGDVDIEAGLLRVHGKGSKRRIVHLTDATQDLLTQWLTVREDVTHDDETALFVTFDRRAPGHGMSTRAIRWTVDKYLARLGLKSKGFSCHSLRHSAATWSRAGGAEMDAIADWLGHASTNTTLIYAKIVDKMTQNPARFLETMLDASQVNHSACRCKLPLLGIIGDLPTQTGIFHRTMGGISPKCPNPQYPHKWAIPSQG